MRASYADVAYRAAWRQKMRARYTDAAYRAAWKHSMRHVRRDKYSDAAYRAAWSHRMRQTMPHKMRANRANPKFTATERRKLQQSRHLKRVNDPVADFTQHIQEGPICTCISCHRHLYRQIVVKLNLLRYKPESRQLLSAMLAAFNSKKDKQLYICRTCQYNTIQWKICTQKLTNTLSV